MGVTDKDCSESLYLFLCGGAGRAQSSLPATSPLFQMSEEVLKPISASEENVPETVPGKMAIAQRLALEVKQPRGDGKQLWASRKSSQMMLPSQEEHPGLFPPLINFNVLARSRPAACQQLAADLDG